VGTGGIERVMDQWLDIKGISEKKVAACPRWLREQLKNGLRHIRVGGKLLVKESWLDEYLENFEVNKNQVDEIVDTVIRGLK
jgi:hypothetical protein